MTNEGILAPASVRLGLASMTKADAIRLCGQVLVEAGAATPEYIDGMFAREEQVSTYLGEGVAIPHGTNEAKSMIAKSSISVIRYPNGIDWNGTPVKFVIGIAGAGNDHLELLGKIAEVFLDESQIAGLEQATSPAQVRDAFGKVNG